MPNKRPAKTDTSRKAKKGFTLAQVTSSTNKTMQIRTESMAIYKGIDSIATKDIRKIRKLVILNLFQDLTG